jgi:hypothetical protein
LKTGATLKAGATLGWSKDSKDATVDSNSMHPSFTKLHQVPSTCWFAPVIDTGRLGGWEDARVDPESVPDPRCWFDLTFSTSDSGRF